MKDLVIFHSKYPQSPWASLAMNLPNDVQPVSQPRQVIAASKHLTVLAGKTCACARTAVLSSSSEIFEERLPEGHSRHRADPPPLKSLRWLDEPIAMLLSSRDGYIGQAQCLLALGGVVRLGIT